MKYNDNSLLVTIDCDWACEAAIEYTLDYCLQRNIRPTVFTTHDSPAVSSMLNDLDVGLHPFFGTDSSHGHSLQAVVKTVLSLPHNIPAFRCHRFLISNEIVQVMADAGMRLSSNVCADLAVIPPFTHRSGLIELPIFMEDGGYLWRQHPLSIEFIAQYIHQQGLKVILIHPMHFMLNSPSFEFMRAIKSQLSRHEWNHLSTQQCQALRSKRTGIGDLLRDVITSFPATTSLSQLMDLS